MKWHTRRFVELPSTQRWLREQAEILPEGSCIYARRQSAGQGRQQRHWQSAPGGLYVSFLLKPAQLLPELPWALWWAALVSLEQASRLTLQLKAPNDILWQGHKLAGLLIDSQLQGTQPRYYICGAGFNLNQSQLEQIGQPACSLWQITGQIWPLETFLKAFQNHFARLYGLLMQPAAFETQLLQALGERPVQIGYNEARFIPLKEYWHEHH